MYTEAAANRTLSIHSPSKTAPASVDGRRFVSEAEWQLLQKEVCTACQCFSLLKVLHRFQKTTDYSCRYL